MGVRASLDAVEKRTLYCPSGIRIPNRPTGSLGTTPAMLFRRPYKNFIHYSFKA